MGYTAAPLEKLIEQFSQFPGIGRKGAIMATGFLCAFALLTSTVLADCTA